MDQKKTATEFLHEFARVLQGRQLYPANHPAVQRALGACHARASAILGGAPRLKWGLHDDVLYLNDLFFPEAPGYQKPLVEFLARAEIIGMEILRGLQPDELPTLVSLVLEQGRRGTDLQDALTAAGAHRLRLVRHQDETRKPREVYDHALKVVGDIFQDIRAGRVPATREAVAVAEEMVGATLSNPLALFALSMIKDYDNYTFTHSVNVGIVAMTVGRACGAGEEEQRLLAFGGMLHDIGKLRVDVEIITKPGKLTASEFDKVKRHPDSGFDLLRRDPRISPVVLDIVRYHHLHYNRAGYPAWEGRPLSPLVDMATIADHYDAMTTLRSYQRPVSPRVALAKMREVSGTSLHPDFLERFAAFLGPFPIGSLVRLDTTEIALVVASDPERGDLTLRLLFDERSLPVKEERRFELPAPDLGRIAGELDPLSRGLDLTRYF